MFKRLLLTFVVFSSAKAFASSPVEAAIVVNAKNGEVIYSRAADQKTQPASLTKMMTLLLMFKALRQKKISANTKIRVSAFAASQSPSILSLKAGETITVRNAILALVVKSANDVAVAVAEHIGKTEKNFVDMMNKEARRLGMSSTIFFNASGWKNTRQLSSARDMAKLASALLKEYSDYYHFFSNKEFSIENKRIKGHNALLGKRGDILVDGIKTGYVAASGFNVAASAVKGKIRLIVVVLGGKTSAERNALALSLFKKGFSKLQAREALAKVRRRKISSVLKEELKPASPPSGIYNKISEASKNDEADKEQKTPATSPSGIYNKINEAPKSKEGNNEQNDHNAVK
ncbi:MAG: D-alanyl-D-alanine carboxypeptidase [Holosporaceae bacterium]|nr:D-alanyl-D-alanine carboxypeptidase [Holosporaceae bacterium]